PGNGGRWHIAGTEQGIDVLRRENARAIQSKAFRGKAGIVADEKRWRRVAFADVTSNGLGGEPHVGKSKFVRDDCAPAGSAELYFCVTHSGRINESMSEKLIVFVSCAGKDQA